MIAGGGRMRFCRGVNLPPYSFIPLLCAVTYVVAALMVKRAGSLGVGVWRIGFLANLTMFVLYLPFGIQAGAFSFEAAGGSFWQPAVTGLLFLGGQLLMFLALQQGDVSVITPVMGTKVLMVALLSLLLRAGTVPWRWWLGAVLSAIAVALLHAGETRDSRTKVGRAVLLTTLSALSYSLSDIFVQKWAGGWGAGRFFFWMFLFSAAYSFTFIPFFRAPLRAIERRAWGWTAGGVVVLGINNVAFAKAIALTGSATLANILYSVRGLVSVAFVWAIGHWFANEERHLPPRVFRARLAGAAVMLAAILVVLL